MRQHRRLPGCRRGRKRQEREPKALPGSQSRTRRRKSQESHQKPVPGQQKAHAWSPPFSAHHHVPVFPSRFQNLLVHPALLASLCCHYASRLKPAPFSKEPEESSRKPFTVGAGDTGRIHFPSPHPAPGVQPRSTQSGEQYPSFNHAYSIWHPFAYTPQASTAASCSDNKRIQRVWRATQDDLNALNAPILMPYK